MNKCDYIQKSIILSIMRYINKKYNKLKDKNLIIKNKLYRDILKNIYPTLKIIKKDNKNGFNINIFDSKDSGIIINYLYNYDVIEGKHIFIIPFIQNSNPLIFYEINKKKKIKAKKIREKLEDDFGMINPYDLYDYYKYKIIKNYKKKYIDVIDDKGNAKLAQLFCFDYFQDCLIKQPEPQIISNIIEKEVEIPKYKTNTIYKNIPNTGLINVIKNIKNVVHNMNRIKEENIDCNSIKDCIKK